MIDEMHIGKIVITYVDLSMNMTMHFGSIIVAPGYRFSEVQDQQNMMIIAIYSSVWNTISMVPYVQYTPCTMSKLFAKPNIADMSTRQLSVVLTPTWRCWLCQRCYNHNLRWAQMRKIWDHYSFQFGFRYSMVYIKWVVAISSCGFRRHEITGDSAACSTTCSD